MTKRGTRRTTGLLLFLLLLSPFAACDELPQAPSVESASSVLISATALKRELASDKQVVLDARDESAYGEGHLPGALFADVGAWEAEINRSGRLQDTELWSRLLGGLSIDGRRPVVLYGDHVARVARAWWLLKFVGVDRVSVLDGGWQAWRDVEGPSSVDIPSIKPCEFRPKFQEQRLVDMQTLREHLGRGDMQLVDNRSREEYTGERRVGSRPGRIPGAIHVDWLDLLDDAGRFKSPQQLRKLFAQRGIEDDGMIVTYCYSGVRSSVGALAFESARYREVRNYVGGWREWSADEQAPADVSR